MSLADRLATQRAEAPNVRFETGTFVRMDGPLAIVNMGLTTIPVRCVGFYPPVVGMSVQLEWRNGDCAVIGPARPLSPIGKITATGSPRAQVTVDGVDHLLYLRSGYTAVMNDDVEVNWATGVIQGKVTGVDTPTAPSEPKTVAKTFVATVRSVTSGKWDYNWNNWWGGSEVWASNSNDGIWTYANRVKSAIAGANITSIEIYLPLFDEAGSCSIGLHAHDAIPAGAPAIGSLQALPLGRRGGWIRLPLSFATYLAAGGRGVGVTAPSGGRNKWRGRTNDSLSGALRFTGTR